MGLLFVIIGCLLLYVFGAPISVRILNVGNAAGLVLGAGFVLYGIFREKLPKKLRTVLKIGFLAGVLLLAVEGIFMAVQAADKPQQEEATVVVLGCGPR